MMDGGQILLVWVWDTDELGGGVDLADGVELVGLELVL